MIVEIYYTIFILFILTEDCSEPPVCENGGFVDFQCQCLCPEGLKGPTCTETEGSKKCFHQKFVFMSLLQL